MMRLENGTTWDGEPIVQVIKTADIVPTGSIWDFTEITRLKLAGEPISEADVVATVDYYPDGSSTAIRLMSLAMTGNNSHVRDTKKLAAKTKAWSHAYKFTATTSNTAAGVPLLAWGHKFEITKDDE